eukprot:748161-Amphidinium_carterae.1
MVGGSLRWLARKLLALPLAIVVAILCGVQVCLLSPSISGAESPVRTNVAESMMSAIDEEKVPLEDALYVMRDMERTEHGRNAINDAVTDNIRF